MKVTIQSNILSTYTYTNIGAEKLASLLEEKHNDLEGVDCREVVFLYGDRETIINIEADVWLQDIADWVSRLSGESDTLYFDAATLNLYEIGGCICLRLSTCDQDLEISMNSAQVDRLSKYLERVKK